MKSVIITKQEMDDKLTEEKGWICTRSGNEYIYDFHLSKYPIIIKVASTIKIDDDRKVNRGSDVIRIFAVRKESIDKKATIIGGLIKARRVYRTTDWRDNLERQIYSVIKSSKLVYDKYKKQEAKE